MVVIYWTDVFSVLSNAVFFLPSYAAFKENYKLTSLIYFFMAWASAFYHNCLSFDACLFAFEFHFNLDFFFAQFLIIVAASLLIKYEPAYRYLEYWFLATGALGVVLLQITFNGNFAIQAGLVSFIFILLVVYWVVSARYKKTPKYEWDMFLQGISLTGGSITLFVFQNTWYQKYWLIHSIWHIAAALGQYYLVKLKRASDTIMPSAHRIRA